MNRQVRVHPPAAEQAHIVRIRRIQIIGRAQARFSPMGNGPLVAELLNAPMFAQLRYTGPADTLWPSVTSKSTPVRVSRTVCGTTAPASRKRPVP